MHTITAKKVSTPKDFRIFLSSLKPCKCNNYWKICTVQLVQFQKIALHKKRNLVKFVSKLLRFFLTASYTLLLLAVQEIGFLVFVCLFVFYKGDFQNFTASPIWIGERPPVWVSLLSFCILNMICVLLIHL